MRLGSGCEMSRQTWIGVAGFICLCNVFASGLRRDFSAQPFDGAVFVLLWDDIGLAPGATMSLNITNTADTSDMVLVILSRDQWVVWMTDQQKTFSMNSSYLISYYRVPFYHHISVRHVIVAPRPERYYVGVLNVHRRKLRLKGTMEFVNPHGQHLPYQMVHMPDMLFFMTVVFVTTSMIMTLILCTIWVRGVTLLHCLLLLCMALKSTNLYFHWQYYEVTSRIGTQSIGRYEAWKLVKRLYEISEVFLLLLTALGWKLLRARLSTTELKFMVFAFCTSSSLAMLQAWSSFRFPDDYQEEPGKSFDLIFYIIRVVCYLVIIFAMNLNLQLIEMHLRESPFTRTVAILYHKRETYVAFRRLFIVLVFRPSIDVLLELLVIPSVWACQGLGEVCMVVVYWALFLIVRPIFPIGGSRQHRLNRLMQEPPAGGDSGSDTSLEFEDGQAESALRNDRVAGLDGTDAPEDGPDARQLASAARRRVGSRSPGGGASTRSSGSGGLPRILSGDWSIPQMPQPVDEGEINVNYIPLAG